MKVPCWVCGGGSLGSSYPRCNNCLGTGFIVLGEGAQRVKAKLGPLWDMSLGLWGEFLRAGNEGKSG